jgi:hypothetical protein
MKFSRICIVLIGIFALILSSISASAETETDQTGDVYHWIMVDSEWSWQPSVEQKPNIDITELTYIIGDGQMTISMKVSGAIESSDNIAYMAWVNTSDATYQMYLLNEQKIVMAMNTEEGGMPAMNTDITISGDTITCTIELVGTDETSTEFWGYAMEYTEFGAANQEWWGDWIPGTYAPFWGEDGNGDEDDDTNDDSDSNGDGGSSTDSNGTPGFEVMSIFIAMAIAVIIMKRRK